MIPGCIDKESSPLPAGRVPLSPSRSLSQLLTVLTSSSGLLQPDRLSPHLAPVSCWLTHSLPPGVLQSLPRACAALPGPLRSTLEPYLEGLKKKTLYGGYFVVESAQILSVHGSMDFCMCKLCNCLIDQDTASSNSPGVFPWAPSQAIISQRERLFGPSSPS